MTVTGIPKYFNIGVACTQCNARNRKKTAVIVDHQQSGVFKLTREQLRAESNRFGHFLNQNLSSLPDKNGFNCRVILWLPNCLEFPVTFLGCLKAGKIAVPLSTLLTAAEVDYLATDSGAEVMVTTPELLSRLDDLTKSRFKHIWLVSPFADPQTGQSITASDMLCEALESVTADDIDSKTRPDDPAYLVYTSGTTGYPKGVLHAHRSLLGRLPASYYWFDYQDDNDHILHSGKFNWTYVLGTALMDPLYLGKSVTVCEGEIEVSDWMKVIARHRCTIFIGVPSLYRQIIQKTEAGSDDVPSLRYCMCAGEHLSDEMLDAWKLRFKLDIYEAIGMSECSYYLSQHASRPVKPGSAGCPQPGHLVELLNDNMQPVADNEEGMLCINLKDPGLFKEYWGLPEETARTRCKGYFLTGDYARRDEEGYYWFLGRRDDIINSFGYRVSPMEIERVLKVHPEVADCVVLEESAGQDKTIVSACVIPERPGRLSEKELIQYARAHLATYKVPRRIRFVEEFPRTANGKILRSKLKKQWH